MLEIYKLELHKFLTLACKPCQPVGISKSLTGDLTTLTGKHRILGYFLPACVQSHYFDGLREVLDILQLKTGFKHPEFTVWILGIPLSVVFLCLTFWLGLLGSGLLTAAIHSPGITIYTQHLPLWEQQTRWVSGQGLEMRFTE